jgi:long-chain acyl-CoA synthetase
MIAVPINYRFIPEELAYVISDSGTETIFVSDDMRGLFDSMRPYLKEVKNVIAIGKPAPGDKSYDELVTSYPTLRPEIEVDENDLAYLIYTSGTTAMPKGTMRNHKSMMASAVGIISSFQLRREDICFNVLPVFTIAYFWATVAYPYMGCTTVIKRWDPVEFLKFVQREKATIGILVPSMIRAMVQHADLEEYDISSLRRIIYGSAPMPEPLLRQTMEVFGNVCDQVYGMTEFAPATMIYAEELDVDNTMGKGHRLLSCGKEIASWEVRIVDESDKDVVPGQPGEIIIKGDALMSGYWNLPEKTAESLKGGYYYSGDIAKFDEDGYIYIVDRKHDMLISGSENVYCPEVENILSYHPAVLEAAVLGVPDEKWGEAVKGLVILKPGMTATENDIIDFCRSRLAGFKRPRSIDFYEEFPLTAMGKVSKKDLREKYWSGYDRRIH